MNWDGALCASIVGMLPLGVRNKFVQEATVAKHELEQRCGHLFCTLTGLHQCLVVGQKSRSLRRGRSSCWLSVTLD